MSIGSGNTLTPGSVAYLSSGATSQGPVIAADGKGGGVYLWQNGSNGDGEIYKIFKKLFI